MSSILILVGSILVQRSHLERSNLGRELLRAAWADDRHIALTLLRRGANVNFIGPAYDEMGDRYPARRRTTALILAAEHGDLTMARILLARGANLNLRDEDGNTALHAATSEGYPTVAKLLLDRGADYRTRNRYGNTALDLTSRPDWPAGTEASNAIARMIRARRAADRKRQRPGSATRP